MIKNRKRCLYSLSDNSYPECDRKSTGRSLPSVTRIAHRADVPKHKNVYYRAMWSLVSAGCARRNRAMHPGVLQSEEPFGRYNLRQTMITLVPIPKRTFRPYKAEWISFYADANVRADHWPASFALALAQEEFRRMLTSGLSTPGHHIYNICEQQSRQKVCLNLWSSLVSCICVVASH